MVDDNIKKIIIENKNFPDISSINEGYLLRYRIISEDKNRASHWSPIVLLNPEYEYELGVIGTSSSQSLTTFSWDPVGIKKNNNLIRTAVDFDVWIRYDRNDGGDWIYKQRIAGNAYSTPHPSTYTINGVVQSSAPNRISVEVYLKGNPVSRNSSFLKVYEVINHSL